MEPVLTTVVTALVAGAAAKAKDVASEAVADAYAGLKAVVVRKLGKVGAVQSVEDDPDSEPARAALAEALAKREVAGDRQLEILAGRIVQALAETRAQTRAGMGDIEVETIRGAVNVVVENLVATGRISLGPIISQAGDLRLSGLSAGTDICTANGSRATQDGGESRKN
jgi:hypothetical protein